MSHATPGGQDHSTCHPCGVTRLETPILRALSIKMTLPELLMPVKMRDCAVIAAPASRVGVSLSGR